MRLQLRTIVGFVVPASLLSATASAAVINVPADFASIQAAIIASACGDEIVVAPGTYNEAIDFMGNAITVRSSGGPDVTTIDATGLNLSVVKCISDEGPSTILRGFTITGGIGTPDPFAGGFLVGGGMYNKLTSPTVINCIFTENNGAHTGGGMFNRGSSPTVLDCTFSHNAPTDHGGGMYNFDSSNPIVTNCTFTQNIGAADGAGMFNHTNSSPTVTNCTFSGNSVTRGNGPADGGGMVNAHNSNPKISNCTFSQNIAGTAGGAIWNSADSLPIVAGSSFCQNTPDDILGRWTDAGGNVFGMCHSADITGPGFGPPDGCIDGNDLAMLLGAWCSVAGGNPCGTCFP